MISLYLCICNCSYFLFVFDCSSSCSLLTCSYMCKFTAKRQEKRSEFWVHANRSILWVKSMQRSGTEATRTQIQPSKPKREITNITNSQNTKRTYGQPNEQLFPKRLPLSNRNRTENNINTHKVKRHQNSDTKNRQQRTKTKLPPWKISKWDLRH